ncbi:hypothetical protein KAR91_54860 [Candidatus Pacearchaeota archaeon]|nr:hypothetical protein [Candidatus Pacearchaeota archaeon]
MSFKNFEGTLFTLKESNFTFYLTGSRYFGGKHSDSDWDFFTEDSEEVRVFLGKLGFERLKSTKYADHGVTCVYRHLEKIDVQLVEDPGFRQSIQKVLKDKKHFINRAYSRGTRTHIWNIAYDIAEMVLP